MARASAVYTDFAEKRVLVTGGANGLGAAIVKKFYENQAHVLVLDKDRDGLVYLQESLPGIRTFCVDLCDWEESRRILQSILPIHHLVSNAGIYQRGTILGSRMEDVDRSLNTNFKAPWHVGSIIGKRMVSKNSGTIVNISSIADSTCAVGGFAYSCSKAALTMLTKAMAVEFGPGVRVNCVCPTVMDTNMHRDDSAEMREEAGELLKGAVIQRVLDTTEAANAVLFLSSSSSSMITGQALKVDGGFGLRLY